MIRSNSLEKVHNTNVSNSTNDNVHTGPGSGLKKRSKRYQLQERYHITIKPKLHRSSSLSDLSPNSSDFSLDFLNGTKNYLYKNRLDKIVYETSGDAAEIYWSKDLIEQPFMSLKLKGKKSKKKSQMLSTKTYASKFATEYIRNLEKDNSVSSCGENFSICSMEEMNAQKAAFPFKPTPSGNLKVQSNQVVFQSSTVGVLLADPTQAKVKVKFEGKATEDQTDRQIPDDSNDSEPQLQFGPKVAIAAQAKIAGTFRNSNKKSHGVKEEKGRDLTSLGYVQTETLDWTRVQLPKKQDLFQEFYRRIHNFINTDTVVRIGKDEFLCHRIVLQIYSAFFDVNNQQVIELSKDNVTSEAFHIIYEWMISNGQESNRIFRKDNILDLFCAAQFLAIKDLEDQCWSFIVNEHIFNEDTAFVLYRKARVRELVPVMDIMVPRVMKFFLPLVASNDFLQLEPDEVMTFLKSNYINVTSEIEVLMAGIRWLYGDWANRKRHSIEVMKCVRFGLISPWQLVDIKRNPDNAEILEIINEAEIQQMVDDGLAYVIIKYWYGNNSKNYYHWIDVLGLSEPCERNWIGEEKNHGTYRDFLKYLEQFLLPKEQMYQHMAMMQTTKRDDCPGNMRGLDNTMDMKRPKMDFPLPATLKGLTGDKEKFPTMGDFYEVRNKERGKSQCPSPSRSPPSVDTAAQSVSHERKNANIEQKPKKNEENRTIQSPSSQQCCKQIHEIHMCKLQPSHIPFTTKIYEQPEKDSAEDLNTTSEASSEMMGTSTSDNMGYIHRQSERKHSIAASYLAAATAALSGSRRDSQSPTLRGQTTNTSRTEANTSPTATKKFSPQASIFNQSKESLARINMNKLSTSILGPSNKNYIAEGSLFNWDRETVLVFGGIDPHTSYGVAGNTGKDIYRFDPVTNTWDLVGELPEPRHHHSVAFLRGRVFLVGGADPREDDLRGKSVVVSTVWSFEPVTRSWYSESGLATPRKNFGLVVHRMALYAIGGQDKKGRVLRSVERFDPKTGSWSEVRGMCAARMAAAAAKHRDYIWVAGGMTGEKRRPVCGVVECYNSNTNQWTQIHSLRFPRCFATLFSMNDKLYIIGGAGKISEKDKTPSSVGAIDVWDWKDRAWKLETEMSIPRHGHALAYLGTQLIIIGGVTTIYMRALSNVESFCCERGAWIRGVSTLPSPLSGHGAVTLPPASLM
nr:uncharacterized protein LOC116767787 isoform X3 [Danaus plexippus plexippus]